MRKGPLLHTSLAAMVLLSLFHSRKVAAETSEARVFSFAYEVEVDPVPAGEGPIDVFVPIAQNGPHQDVLSYEVRASIPGQERIEGTYDNRFWHGHLDRSDGRAITVTVTYRIRRRAIRGKHLTTTARDTYTEDEIREHARFLRANRRVPTSGEPIDSIVREIAPGETSLVRIARATYDYVVDNMEYKKVGSGWGNGDTYWACSTKYGNCTDFHALLISLARARGIPARFEIGFPIPTERPAGKVGGYHCWVSLLLPGLGWVPIDASEAKKHPEQRDLLFGNQPADRVQLAVGRDLELGEGHTTGPLSYFVYPHVEVGGELYDGVRKHFAYKELDSQAAALSASTAAIASETSSVAREGVATTDPSPAAALERSLTHLFELYGFIRLDAIFDDSRMQNSQYAMWVLSEARAVNPRNDARFTLHPRLSRLGVDVGPCAPSESLRARAKLEIDFQNGGKESRSIIRMRHAYFAVAMDQLELLAGQTWDVLSPLYPGANSDGMMWNAGNLGDRHPQARLTFTQPLGKGSLSMAAAATMTGAVDNQDLDGNGELDGFAAATPGLQARIGVAYPLWLDTPVKLGVWGGWGREETQRPVGGKTELNSWVAGFDLSLPIVEWLAIEGEGWLGEDLSDIRGGIGQGVNSSTGEEIFAMGGWAQIKARVSKSWHFFAGLTVDRPEPAAVPDGGRTLNAAGFAVTRFRPWEKLQIGLEYLYWMTEYRNLRRGIDNRVNLHLTYFL